MNLRTFLIAVLTLVFFGFQLSAEIKIISEHNGPDARPPFTFKQVPPPARGDAGGRARITILDGERDRNGGDVAKLNDDRIPAEADIPAENFFFVAGSEGGRLLLDLGAILDLKQVNTYSWHPGARGPQVYRLYASDGVAENFNRQPSKDTALEASGWKSIAQIDTRPKSDDSGGQHGVSISDATGALGRYRYLLFDVSRTQGTDSFGNTFFSEIDVLERDVLVSPATASEPDPVVIAFDTEKGKYQFTIDVTAAPDLKAWAEAELVPVVKKWYPAIVDLLPGPGFEAATNVNVRFRNGMGGTPASAGGSGVNCNIDWFRRNLQGEARGAVVHELVHVVQQYGRARRNNPNATRTPSWLTEGIADYIRWFRYEPESKGAQITARNLARAKFDASYRITGNFLDWATEKYDPKLVPKLNAAARQGKYHEDLWKEATGKTLQELGDEWRKTHEERLKG
jgi:hypothetical protein